MHGFSAKLNLICWKSDTTPTEYLTDVAGNNSLKTFFALVSVLIQYLL